MTIRFRRKGGIRLEEPRPEPSFDDVMDKALMRGGVLAEVATSLGIDLGRLQHHLKRRVESGRWRFQQIKTSYDPNNPHGHLLAGRLIKTNQIVRHKRKKANTTP